MRHFTLVAAGFAVAAAGTAAIAAEAPTSMQYQTGLTLGQVDTGSSQRTGTSISYSSLGLGTSPFDNFQGGGFSHGSTPVLDDVLAVEGGALEGLEIRDSRPEGDRLVAEP